MIRRPLGCSDAARAEDEAHLWFVVTRSDAGRRPLVVGAWPDDDVVESDVVRSRRPGLESFDQDERVVVPLDVEGARALAEDRHLAGSSRLDPDRGRLGPT